MPRPPEEIRASIESNRMELAVALTQLRDEVDRATDWRGQLREHREQMMIGAGVAGFVIAGGIAAIGGLFSRGRRRGR
jgi:hypothetical protein